MVKNSRNFMNYSFHGIHMCISRQKEQTILSLSLFAAVNRIFWDKLYFSSKRRVAWGYSLHFLPVESYNHSPKIENRGAIPRTPNFTISVATKLKKEQPNVFYIFYLSFYSKLYENIGVETGKNVIFGKKLKKSFEFEFL